MARVAHGTSSPKFQMLEIFFGHYLEPLDIIDYFDETGCFKDVGIKMRRTRFDDDSARRERVSIFMEWFEQQSAHPIFQEVLQVFKTVESCNWMVPLLDDDFSKDFFPCLEKVAKIDKLKYILQTLMPRLRGIDAIEVAHYMTKYLTDEESQVIQNIARTNSNSHAVFCLLHKLILKQPGWIEHFIDAIRSLNLRGSSDAASGDKTLVELLEDYCGCYELERAIEEHMVIEGEAETSLKSSYIPKVEALNLGPQPNPNIAKEELLEMEDHQNSSLTVKVKETAQALRQYQKELCKKALLGENTVICAPTNSGKTVVVAHIIKNHLSNGCGKSKVLFFTPTGGLAEQQFGKLKEYLVEYRMSIAILHGGMEDRIDESNRKTIYSHDVIVMTPQILINCINKKSVQSLRDFTLMIFDECHHTRASHPYCEIMRMHLGCLNGMNPGVSLNKISRLDHIQRPVSVSINDIEMQSQIIGLTATLGIGAAEDEEQAKENIFMLLSMMDASGGLSMVTDPDNLDELHRYCPTAPEEWIYIDDEDDQFKMDVCKAAQDILDHITTIHEHFKLQPAPVSSSDVMSKNFESWCQKLRNAAVGHFDDKGDDNNRRTLGRDATSCAHALLMLVKIYRMSDNCHPTDVISTLEKFIENQFTQDCEKNTKLENTFREILENTMKMLRECLEETENKMLKEMVASIQEKEHEDEDFRCMVMVSRRLYAECLTRFVERSEFLRHLGCKMYIGVGSKSSSDTHGMTHKKQAEAIESFKKGECKVLVCTPDAAGEGIDIKKCNLVITVECVANEIKLVQLKGRARTVNSKVIHICFKRMQDNRDTLPYKKKKLMTKVTRQIDRMFKKDPSNYQKELKAGRQRALSKIEEARKRKANSRPKHPGMSNSLVCRKCSRTVCSVTQIIKINGNHHTVDIRDFQSMYSTQLHKNRGSEIPHTGMTQVNRISCSDCKQEWGNEVEFKGKLLPIVGIRGFKIYDRRTHKCHHPSKWAKTGLDIRRVDSDDRFLASLPDIH